MVRRYPDSLFVVTSRRTGYDDEPLDERILNRYVVQPMEDDDITAFVNDRFGEGTEEAANTLSILDDNPEIKVLAANPLQLSIINLIHREVGVSTAALKRTDLYRKATGVLIKDQDEEGQSIEPDDFRKDILFAIAHHIQQSGYETIGKRALERFVVRFLEEEKSVANRMDARNQAEKFVRLAGQRTGLLVEQPDSDETEFGFLHASFREYLTAEYIEHQNYASEPDDYWEEIKEHLEDARWREVILFLLGILERKYCTYLAKEILAAGDAAPKFDNNGWSLETHLQLAADALARQSPMAPELQQEIIGRLQRIVDRLERENRDVEFPDMWDAIRSLGEIRHMPQAVYPVLVRVVTNSKARMSFRIEAATALGRVGYKSEAMDFLTGIVKGKNTNDTYARINAVRALGVLGQTMAAVDALKDVAQNSEANINARMWAAVELNDLDNRAVAIDTMAAIVDDPTVTADFRSLAKLNWADFLVDLDERQMAMEALTSIANDPEVGSKRQLTAALMLCDLLGERNEAKDVLTRIAKGGDDGFARLSAAWELANLGEDVTTDVFASIAKPESTDGRPWGQPLKQPEGAPLNLG